MPPLKRQSVSRRGFLAVMAARALAEMHRRWPRAHRAVVVLLALVWAHDLPAMITRHVP